MGLFETAVVVYLREIYYSGGFSFPLEKLDPHVGLTELLRELASMAMIVSVSCLAFSSFYKRFAAFMFIFGVWDIFYYVFLKIILGWPENLLTWDILFLIPVLWTGPVITPMLVALIMIVLSLLIFRYDDLLTGKFYIQCIEWGVFLAGACIIFLSFIWDYSQYIIENIDAAKDVNLSEVLKTTSLQYVPQQFNWILYSVGVVTLIFAVIMIYWRHAKENKK